MKTEKQTFWDSYSTSFNSIYGTKNNLFNHFINKFFRQSMKIRFAKTIENIPSRAQTVLDIGCGPGHFCIELAKKNIPHIVGIDFSKEMIALAKINATSQNITNNIQFMVGDYLTSSDVIKYEYTIMMGFIEYFEDPFRIIKKVVENTKENVFISFPKDGGLLGLQRKFRYKNRCYLKLYSRKELEVLLSKLNISSYLIDDAGRDYYVTLTI